MSKKDLHSRIYLKNQEKFTKVMNIFSLSDDSIAMSFYGFRKHQLFCLQGDKKINIETINDENYPKITFHKSGIIKLTSRTPKNNIIDRITWRGPSFDQIDKPYRMLEIILPPKLLVADKATFRKEQDIILDASSFPNKQWRVTVFCTPSGCFRKLGAVQWVSTSECEYIESLERKELVWSWVLRVSASDKRMSNEFMFFVPWEIEWPNS